MCKYLTYFFAPIIEEWLQFFFAPIIEELVCKKVLDHSDLKIKAGDRKNRNLVDLEVFPGQVQRNVRFERFRELLVLEQVRNPAPLLMDPQVVVVLPDPVLQQRREVVVAHFLRNVGHFLPVVGVAAAVREQPEGDVADGRTDQEHAHADETDAEHVLRKRGFDPLGMRVRVKG